MEITYMEIKYSALNPFAHSQTSASGRLRRCGRSGNSWWTRSLHRLGCDPSPCCCSGSGLLVTAGERRVQAYSHEPVMCREVVGVLADAPDGVLLDATVGGGGHAAALLDRRPGFSLVGLDRDPAALGAAADRLREFRSRATLHHTRFDELGSVLDGLGCRRITAALFDLGVSSAHLDQPERGFSYRLEGPLDMRMDPADSTTAADIVNRADERTLTSILRENSDERYARRIADAIVARRPFATTTELAGVVRSSVPAAARRGSHPARRTFQALRIEVNSELEMLAPAVETALERLAPAGRCAVLSYHSGEDRIVKSVLRRAAGILPPPLGPPQLGTLPPARPPASVRLLWNGVRTPCGAEMESNRRASSARLRAVERLDERA